MSDFASAVNFVRTTLRLPYVPGSGQVFLYRGYGASVNTALTNQGLPSISVSAPLRFMLINAQYYNAQTQQIIDPQFCSIFEATGLSGDNLTGCTVVEGTVDQAFNSGDIFVVQLTAGQINDIQSAVVVLQGSTGAPATATYILQTANSSLTSAQVLASLSTGLLKVTTTTGVLSTAVAGTDYLAINGNGSGLTNLTAANLVGTVAIANGGTGQTSSATAFNALSPITTLGDLIYGSAANTSSRLAGNTTATALYLTQTGTGTVSAAPVWAAISTGDLPTIPVNKGGTGQVTANAGFGALSPLSTLGDMLYFSTVNARLAGNITATKNFLVQTGNGSISAAPSWGTIVAGDLPNIPISGGGTGQVTASAAFNALMPLTTLGDTLYASGVNTSARLAGNTSATQKFLAQTGNGSVSAAPSWVTIATSDLPTIPISGGGTGQTTAAAAYNALSPMTTLGDIEYESGANTAARLAGNTTTTQKFLAQTGNGSVSAAPSWTALASGDLPTVPINKGGTGQTTQSAGFNALSPLTTVGDILYGAASGAGTRLGGNTAASNKFLRSTGDGVNATAPTWSSIVESDVTSLTSDLLLRMSLLYKTGNYFPAGWAGTVNTNTTTNNTMRAFPLYLPPMTITRLVAEVTGAGDAGRSVADMVTSSSTTITSATAAFVSTDQGRGVSGTNIPAGTYIQSVTNGTTAVMTIAATGSGSGGSLTITGCVVRLGIYNDDGTGNPGTLLVDGATINGNSATVQEVTVSAVITGGLYWFAGVTQGVTTTQPTLRTMTNLVSYPVPNANIPTAGQLPAGVTMSSVPVALPSPFVLGALSTTANKMWIKM